MSPICASDSKTIGLKVETLLSINLLTLEKNCKNIEVLFELHETSIEWNSCIDKVNNNLYLLNNTSTSQISQH